MLIFSEIQRWLPEENGCIQGSMWQPFREPTGRNEERKANEERKKIKKKEEKGYDLQVAFLVHVLQIKFDTFLLSYW